jgi:NADPH:quinone reductase-like Zn-dependent oxidoreductase
MRAVVYRRYGGPEVLEIADLPEPKVHLDSVLVRVHAAAVNPADLAMRDGAAAGAVNTYFPVIPGWDIAGVVQRAGIGAPDFAPGDEVIGYVRGEVQRQHGGYAELVAADVRTLTSKPANLTWEQAAALPLAGLTAYRAIVYALNLSAGETLLVHAAAGGVGSLAVQLARSRGATVIGTASPRNHDYLRSLGAIPVTYGPGLADRVRTVAPDGVDAVFDTAGNGALLSTPQVGNARVRTASIVEFSYPGTIPVFARLERADFHALTDLAAAGLVTPRVGATYPLDQAANAHRAATEGLIMGKIVLTVP